MAEEESRFYWPQGWSRLPDGVSASTPTFPVIGGIGGTYYLNPGAPSAPRVTVTKRTGMGGGGLHAVFLRDGMTSQDTLGYGATADLGLGPTATVNVNIPSEKGIPQPWNARVSSIEGGAGVPGFAATTTYTPQQITDFLTRYILPPPSGPDSKATFVRDSVASAGVPSRNNVFEYGFPEPSSAPPTIFDTGAPAIPYLAPISQKAVGGMTGRGASSGDGNPDLNVQSSTDGAANGSSVAQPPTSVFAAGAPPVPYLPATPAAPQKAPGGLLGMMLGAGVIDPLNPDQPAPGGLYPLMLEYMRNNPDGGTDR